MADEVWVGLDLGTQSARALAVAADGEVVGQGSAPLTSHRDGPRHEQDPQEWWQAVSAASREALGDLGSRPVAGVALCGTSGTVALVDGQGAPLTPGLMYDDTRAIHEARVAQEAGAEVWDRHGYRIQPSWALPKLLWLVREYAGDLYGARLAHQPDFVTRRLIGEPVASDTSHALKTGFDLLKGQWPSGVLSDLGVPEGLLPDVVRSGAQLGVVGAPGAEATGIPRGTPVIAGMTDGCAAQLGAGALSTGSWNSVLGTTLVLKGVTDELISDPTGVVYSHRSPEGGWLPGGASSVGAGVLSARFPGRDLDELGRQAQKFEPAGAVIYPLAGQGERFPFTAPAAEGFALGESSGEGDRFAALLQGVAYVERLCFDYLHLLGAEVDGALTLTGGGARSRYWCQLRADVLGRAVLMPANAEGALGMAVLAAGSQRPLTDVAQDMVRIREQVEPRPGLAGRFDEAYVTMVDELERRDWLPERVAAHARSRAG